MRRLVVILFLALAACTQATVSRLGNNTFRVFGPGVASTAPNKRIASELCPGGYRVLHQSIHENTPNGYYQAPGTFINWTIRCL